MLLVPLALKTLPSISQNRMVQITLNKHLGNRLNKDIISASISLSSFFLFVDASTYIESLSFTDKLKPCVYHFRVQNMHLFFVQ